MSATWLQKKKNETNLRNGLDLKMWKTSMANFEDTIIQQYFAFYLVCTCSFFSTIDTRMYTHLAFESSIDKFWTLEIHTII